MQFISLQVCTALARPTGKLRSSARSSTVTGDAERAATVISCTQGPLPWAIHSSELVQKQAVPEQPFSLPQRSTSVHNSLSFASGPFPHASSSSAQCWHWHAMHASSTAGSIANRYSHWACGASSRHAWQPSNRWSFPSSHSSSPSTTPLPQSASQSLSLLPLHADGQHPSSSLHAEIDRLTHRTSQLRGLPNSVSTVQESSSSQLVLQSPSQVSPRSVRPLPQSSGLGQSLSCA